MNPRTTTHPSPTAGKGEARENGRPRSVFDVHSHDYDAVLNQGLAVSGENASHFARARILWLRDCLAKLGERPASVLDFGCGRGSSASLFLEILGAHHVTGIDSSDGLLSSALADFASDRIAFFHRDGFEPNGTIDLAFCNGVFHHISPGERSGAARYLFRSLRSGGLLAFWENNPWNPAARFIMNRIPFDRGTKMLSPRAARRMLRDEGFRVERTDHLFLFPRVLKALRPLERLVSRLPLGTQYQVLCRKETER